MLKIEADNPAAHKSLRDAYFIAEKYQQAIYDLHAVALDPENALAYMLGLSHQRLGYQEPARGYFDQAMELNPEFAAARLERGNPAMLGFILEFANKPFGPCRKFS